MPLDLCESKETRNNIELYARSVFVTNDYDELMPEWMSMVKGVVDSENLPIDVFRENAQQS